MNSGFVFFLLFFLAEAVNFPPTFKRCSRKDPGINQCLLEALQINVPQLTHPFPELRIPNLRPLEIPQLSIPGKGAVAVDQNFKNCKVYGFDKIIFKDFEFNFDEKSLKLKAIIPELLKQCDYELNGKVLLLPIVGQGESTITLKDLMVNGFFKYVEEDRNGKVYIRFVTTDIKLETSRLIGHFENLFNGDRAMTDAINKVLNDNWKMLFDDVKDGYCYALDMIITGLLNNFFSIVSFDEALE